MIYTVGRLLEDLRTIGGEFSSDWSLAKAKMIAEEALAIFFTYSWPFNQGEAAVATVAPYSTGTVAVTLNSPTVTLSGGTWVTSWTTPAIIRINGSGGDTCLVQSFDTSSTATLDINWPFATDLTATYSIEFPTLSIPSYISVTGVSLSRLSIPLTLQLSTPEAMLAARPWMVQSFWPGEYAVIPSDGVTGQKMMIWPGPASVQTVRYKYIKSVPSFRLYRAGSVDVTNGNTAVVGTSTLWKKQGYSIIGQYLELQDDPGNQVLITANASDTALTLTTGGWTGQTQTGWPYYISPQILCPDDLKPLLRAIVRWKFLQDSAPNIAPMAEARYIQLRDQAIARYDTAKDVGSVQPIMAGDYDWGAPPPLPSILRVEP